MSDSVWSVSWPIDEVDEWQVVPVQQIDLSAIPPGFASHRMPTPTFSGWLDRDPMYVNREYNWRDATGQWRRRYGGIGNGRHRMLVAEAHGHAELRIQVLGYAFWPWDSRPFDRLERAAAKCIEKTRTAYRLSLLASDSAM